MGQANMSTKKPMALVFAGPNGSGKTTIKDYFEIVGEYTNADDIVKSMGISNVDAAKAVDERRYASIDAGKDFTFETVLSSDYKMNLLQYAKNSGYFIKCVFVLTANPKINIARVKARVELGGHDVAADKIESRYYKSLSNIPKLIELCDILHVYDNSVGAERIIRKHKDQFTIFPNEIWDEDRILRLVTGKQIKE